MTCFSLGGAKYAFLINYCHVVESASFSFNVSATGKKEWSRYARS